MKINDIHEIPLFVIDEKGIRVPIVFYDNLGGQFCRESSIEYTMTVWDQRIPLERWDIGWHNEVANDDRSFI